MRLRNDLPASTKDKVVTAYEAGGLDDAITAIAHLNVQTTAINLQRRIQEHRKLTRNVFREDGAAKVHEAQPTMAVPLFGNRQQPAALTDLYHIDLETDQGPWVEWLHHTAETKRFITVMHLADIHFPFEHGPALEVAYQLVEHVQPNLIVVGSDAADFALIATFEPDKDQDEDTPDILDEFEAKWTPFIHRLKQAAPGSKLVFIWGNHERRILKFLNRQAPKFRKRILRDFIEIVRCGGAVQYLGNTDYVRVGPLVVHHGTRTGFYAAKNSLLDAGSQVSMMGGHVHYPSEYDIQGEEHTVRSIISGCLCAYPHYMTGVRMTKPPQLARRLAMWTCAAAT